MASKARRVKARHLSPEQGTTVNHQPGSAATSVRFCPPSPEGVLDPSQLAEQLQVRSDGGTTP